MKKKLHLALTGIICSIVLICAPLSVLADPVLEPPVVSALPPILITEIQTGLAGSGNASKEFIELYNTTDAAIDLSAWQLWYVSASATNLGQPTKRITFQAAAGGQPLSIASRSHLVLSGNQAHLADIRHGLYEATLAASGHLRLVRQTDDYQHSCQLALEDSVSWGAIALSPGSASPAPAPGESLERLRAATGEYIYTRSAADFAVTAVASPGVLSQSGESVQSVQYETLQLPDPGCTPAEPVPEPLPVPPAVSPPSVTENPQPEVQQPSGDEQELRIPAGNIGLAAPQISELLPNPAAPQTDAQDEFIELYNPNDKAFDLSGYVLEAGLTTKRRHVFAAGTSIQSGSFLAFFSADTSISLSNTQGQVRLLDPLGAVLAESDAYTSAKDGQAWLLANGVWQWTTKPTPNALNVVSLPRSVQKASTSKAKKSSNSTKGASATAKPAKAESNTEPSTTVAATTTSRSPVHGGILALIGGFALLYGAYEYRRDVANKFHQFRSNRATRRALRQSAKGQ